MTKEKLIKSLKENGFLEIELSDNKEIYITSKFEGYIAELDIWDINAEDWKLIHRFKPVTDPEKLINSLMNLFEL